MYCTNCGNQIDDNAVVCIHCGAPTPNAMYQQQYQQPQQPQKSAESNTIAIVGFIFAFFIPLVGLICSCIGLKRAKELDGNQKGLAIAGIIISAVFMLIELVLIGIYGSIFIALITGAAVA